MDKTGLGQGQSLRLAKLLKPQKVMIIDSTLFKRVPQYPDWYKDFKTMKIRKFPSQMEIRSFLTGLDCVITCETFYSGSFINIARKMGVKTVLVFNYEFLENLRSEDFPLPDVMVQPSYWHLDEMKERFNAVYIPTPISYEELQPARFANITKTGKPHFLFINGKTAVEDRNGLLSLYDALKLSKGDYNITIKAQNTVPETSDSRVTYDFSNPDDQNDLYAGYNALIMPRRFGGQCLPMCEALSAGLPVIMTDIDPNNKILPEEWLVPAHKTGELMTRVMLDVYSADPEELAKKIDLWASDGNTHARNIQALHIANEFTPYVVLEGFMEVL